MPDTSAAVAPTEAAMVILMVVDILPVEVDGRLVVVAEVDILMAAETMDGRLHHRLEAAAAAGGESSLYIV